MADVAASVAAATTPSKVDSGQFLGEVQNSGLISPSITAAMDRIFPKSPTQLLPVGFHLDSESDASSKSGSSSATSGKVASPGLLSVTVAQPPCTSSTPPLTTGTTTTSTCVFTTLSTSDSGNSCPITSPSSAATANKLLRCPPLVDSPASGGKSSQSLEKSRRRYVTADREITTIRDGRAGAPVRRSSQRVDGGVEKGSSDSQSRECSDSDDMCRPFAAALKEKKKIKQKKKKRELRSSQVTEITDSEDDFKNSKSKVVTPSSGPSDKDSATGRTESIQSRLSETESSLKNLGKSRNKVVDASILKSPSENLLIPSSNNLEDSLALSKEHIHTNGDVGEDVSNISITSSSSKENATVKLRQKLPKVKHLAYHVKNNRGRIRSAFLPCFVVLERNKLEQSIVLTDKLVHRAHVLPLTDRIKCLANACARKDFKCRKRKKLEHKGDVFVYRNIFEEPMAAGNSEDEFENSRGGRSLRKRNQNISYREPTENEFLEGITAVGMYSTSEKEEKKKKKKKKESDTDSDFLEELKEVQRKKKSQETSTNADVQGTTGNQTDPKANKKKLEGNEKEIVIYPKAPVVDKSAGSKSAAEKKSDPKEVYRYPRNNIPDKVSVLPKSTIQTKTGTAASKPTSVLAMTTSSPGFPLLSNALLTPHTLSVSSLASGSLLTSSPAALGPGVPKPQFFMVRIDGKDFLVPIASNVVGANSSSRFVAPGVASSVAGKVVTQTIMAPSGGKYVMGIPSTSGPAMVTPPRFVGQTLVRREAIPVIPAPPSTLGLAPAPPVTVTGLTGQPQMRGLLPISSTIVATGQPISLVSSVTVSPLTSVSTSKSAAATTTVTTTALTSSRPVRSLLSPLAAPTSTTVLRNRVTTTRPAVHMVAPNSLSSGARCVRIMVPACSATGTPARYATVGSIAASSPLTHMSLSSNLLPQRKRAADQDLTPEKRAAKRRKLEKKYPLPPGVVIKTEPLESFPPPSSMASIRSLLPSNIQLISASSRSGTGGVQSIRIIAPALSSALGPRPIHLGSNVILRGASAATTGSTTAVVAMSQSASGSGGGSVSTATSTTTTTTTAATTTSSITAVPSATTATTIIASTTASVSVCSSHTSTTSSTSNTVISPPTSSTESDSTSSTNQDDSHSSQLTHVATSEESRDGSSSRISTLPISLSTTAALAPVSRTTGLASDQNREVRTPVPTTTPSVDTLKESVEKLQAFIKAQVGLGLKGPRLTKLEDLLKKQEEALAGMEKQSEEQLSENSPEEQLSENSQEEQLSENSQEEQLSENSQVPVSNSGKSAEEVTTAEPSDHIGTEEDPFVID